MTLFLHIDDNDKYEKYSAMIIEEIIDQRYEGIKNEKGVYITPAFPKLIYVLDENNIEGGKYNYITKKAARCTAKRLYPDYISAKKMRENYEGEVFSCMGCVSGNSVIRYKYKGKIYKESFLMMWNRLSNENEVIPQQIINGEKSPHKYMEVEDLYIYDTEKGYVKVKRVIRNKAVSNWMEVRFNNGTSIHCTEDHPFFTRNKGRIPAIELEKRDIMIYNENTDIDDETSKMMNIKVTDINKIKGIYMDSFDVTTESDFFEVNGIYSHNCRSFLSPWKDENGEYKWEGRFNQGVVSINLPQIGIIANGDEDKFWKLLDERLLLCKKALMCRHKHLLGTKSDTSPVHFQYGAISRLKSGETIDKLLKGGYSTISLGYIGVYETTIAMKGVSHTTEEGHEFAIRLMKHLKETVDEWKEETGLGFGLYGSPAESLCYRFAEIDRRRFGDIENITDKGYYTNSYHIDVREKIDAFSKFDFESEFQNLSTGGAISYVEIPNLQNNLAVVEKLIYYIYNHIQYAEFNTKSDYCHVCGFDGEIIINDENEWECPNCGNKDHKKMNVTRRT